MRAFCLRHLSVMLIISLSAVGAQLPFDAVAQRPRPARHFPPGMAEGRLALSSADQLKLNEKAIAALEELMTKARTEEERLRVLSQEVTATLRALMDTHRPAKAELAQAAERVGAAGSETRELRLQTSMRVRALLTDEQLDQFMLLRAAAFKRRTGR